MNPFKYPQSLSQASLNRRSFLRTSVCISLTIASGNILASSDVSIEQLSKTKLISILNVNSSITIGQVILEDPKHRHEFSSPLPSVMNKLDISSDSLSSITRKELSTRLKQQTIRDFDIGHIVNVSGWVLGHTEAKLCVLAAQSSTFPINRD